MKKNGMVKTDVNKTKEQMGEPPPTPPLPCGSGVFSPVYATHPNLPCPKMWGWLKNCTGSQWRLSSPFDNLAEIAATPVVCAFERADVHLDDCVFDL